jgi:hypothetical protein
MSRPFRALSLFLSVPRALPWANISRPFGAQNVYTQNVQTPVPFSNGGGRFNSLFQSNVSPLQGSISISFRTQGVALG